MKILDFGAGWRAYHSVKMRALGLDVTAHDFGRNFDPALHLPYHELGRFDVVMASNVVNVHSTVRGIERTIAQLADVTLHSGFCVVNYPESPRKFSTFKPAQVERVLQQFFGVVERIPGRSCPLWVCRNPDGVLPVQFMRQVGEFTAEEIACANIRPVGAVGANALVPRYTLELLGWTLEQ